MENEELDQLAVKAKTDEEAMNQLVCCPAVNNIVKQLSYQFFLVDGDAEDVRQEILMKLRRAVDDFEPEKGNHFKTFFFFVARRHILTRIKHTQASKNRALNESASIDAEYKGHDGLHKTLVHQDNFVDDLESADETRRILKKLWEKMSDMEKAILPYYLHNCSYEDIADFTGYSTKQIDNCILRIKGKAKKVEEKEKKLKNKHK